MVRFSAKSVLVTHWIYTLIYTRTANKNKIKLIKIETFLVII